MLTGTHSEAGAPFIVASELMRRFMDMVERVAGHKGNVLIAGETGTGKERIAHTIHEYSQRSSKPFVDINCATLPEHLVESELFGYEKGAFSGANNPKPGLFEMAHGGSLFLDEIGELDLKVQVKLLRVLDRSPYYRLGGQRKITADVRVIAATNRNLKQEVAAGRFRKDLYHRLSQFELCVPPLRDRPEDILALAQHLLAQANNGLYFAPEALQALLSYSWPGNVRELQNAINKIAFAAAGEQIQAEEVIRELSNGGPAEDPAGEPAAFFVPAEQRSEMPDVYVNAEAIQKALASTRGHRGQAAAQLGVSRRTLSRKMREFGLSSPRSAPPPAPGSLSDEESKQFRAEIKVRALLITHQGQEFNCTTNNLGMSGMGIEGLTSILNSRDELLVRFQFPDSSRSIETAARLAWADKQGAAGVLFTSMDRETRIEIDRWLRLKMMEEGWTAPFETSDPLAVQFLPASSYTN